jgi:hypothetical protein
MTMSVMASASHTSTSASGQLVERERPDLPSFRGRAIGRVSVAAASSGSANFRCIRIGLRLEDGSAVIL